MNYRLIIIVCICINISDLFSSNVKVDFTGGSSIDGEIISWNGENGIIKCVLGEISINKDKITPESLSRILAATTSDQSLELTLQNGSFIRGKLVSWDGALVVVDADVGTVTVPVERLSLASASKMKDTPKKLAQSSSITPESPTVPASLDNDRGDYKKLSKFIVIIEGDHSVGTGFMAHYRGKIFLFTNLHVLDGNRNIKCKVMNGKELNLGGMLASTEYDLAAIELPLETDGLKLQDQTDSLVTIGDDVIVFGNSYGGGVATDLNGKILAVGPHVLETDVKFVSGNSGSPIILKKNHQVIGIASFSILRKANEFGKDSKFNNVERRFAYRIDNNPGWQEMTLPQFINESLYLYKIEARTDALWDVAHDIARNDKITRFSYINDYDAKVDELLKPYKIHLDEFGNGVGTSFADYRRSHQSLLKDLSYACESDLKVNYQFCNWHLNNQIEPNREIRAILKGYFNKRKDLLN